MTVYAPVPSYADRKPHPRALLLIIAAHAALLAVVMTAKLDLSDSFRPTKTEVTLVPLPADPPEEQPRPTDNVRDSVVDKVPSVVPLPKPVQPPMDSQPLPTPLPRPVMGPQPDRDVAPPAPLRTGPRFVTSESRVKPPYPQQKLRLEEEAVLRLRLSIDDRGRVTAVEPVGRADAIFLAAARRHLIAHWRYQPATEDGRPVASSTVVTLRFQLDD